MLVAFLLGVAALGDDKAAEARLLNGQGIMSAEDYPLDSLRNEQQGSVTVRLTVSPDGVVSSCKVTQSSGHPALDERTCAIYGERARFEPARDRRGRAIESHFTQKTTWKLAEGSPPLMPREAWAMQFTMAIAADGTAVGCTIEATGIEGMGSRCSVPAEMAPKAQGDTKPVAYAISETRFYPVEPDLAPVAPEPEGAKRIAKQISRITITPDGQVIACKAILYSGESSPAQDACMAGQRPRFEPAAEASGPTVGTLVQSAYARSADVTETEADEATPRP